MNRWLEWEPEQRTFLAHVLWRWTGALMQDAARLLLHFRSKA